MSSSHSRHPLALHVVPMVGCSVVRVDGRAVAGTAAGAGRAQGGPPEGAGGPGQRGLGSPEIDGGMTTTGQVAAYTIRWASSGDIDGARGASITSRSASWASFIRPRRLLPWTTRISAPWSSPSTSATSRSNWACWSARAGSGSCGIRTWYLGAPP